MAAISWKSAISGSWTTAADWNSGTVPGSGDAVTIGVPGAYTVSLIAATRGAASLKISDVRATLAIKASGGTGSTLTVGGTVSNAGSITLTGASAAATLATGAFGNTGSVSLTGKATLTTGAFGNSGMFAINGGPGDLGGGSATLGVLTNNGDFDIGNSSLASALTVTATKLSNAANGTIHLVGGSAQAALKIGAAAPTNWSGFAFLEGNALLQFASGGIAGITANSEISLDGALARVALVASPGTNSALTKLASNAGTLVLENGATVHTTVGFSNAGNLHVDNGSGLTLGGGLNNNGAVAVDGGSQLVVDGTLNNKGLLSIGDSSLSQTTTVTATGFTNTGSLFVAGLSARATLNINGAVPTTITGNWSLTGDGVVEFGSGGATGIAQGGALSLDGPRAHVALSSDTSKNGALATLASNAGFFTLTGGALVSTKGAFTNSGATNVDSARAGGSTLSLGGKLTNNSSLIIGNADILAATTVNVVGLTNAGTLNLTAGSAKATLTDTGGLSNSGSITITGNAAQAKLAVSGAAPTKLSGSVALSGAALLDFGSGAITAIDTGASLSLSGPAALVDIGAALGNSALKTLANNAGTFNLANGAGLATTVGFVNNGGVGVDSGISGGGSSFTIGGTLTNKTSFSIGNTGTTVATSVKATQLVNAGTIAIAGGTAQAKLVVSAAAPSTLTGSFSLTGNALLDYGSGAITAIGSGANLSLSGSKALVDIGATLGNSALKTLASNSGAFGLANGAALATTVGFKNSSSLNVDSGFGATGGASFTIGGTLTNSAFVSIGNNALSAATTVKAAALVNTGSISLTGGPSHANLNITGNASNSGFGFNIDSFSSGGSSGGAIFTVGGTLTNSNSLTIGNSGLTRATAVIVAQLANTGSVQLAGGTAQAKLVVNAAAPSTLTGSFSLSGNALLDYKSGAIKTIGSGASLSLSGSKALVDIGATLGNSALKTLASNAGTFTLANGAALATTVGFSNSSSLNVDSSFGTTGGSSFTIGGTLTNSAFVSIGNSALSAATTVKAAALVNTSSISLTGGPSHANLNITGNASNSGFGFSIDSFSGGGAIFTVGGTLTNSNNLTIGNSGLIRATAVTVAQLVNTGSVQLTGGGTAQAKLVVNAAAPSTLTGTFSLAGNALLDYKSGAITAIGSGASLSLNGSKALVDIGATLGNSALKTLASNAGTFNLANGAALTTTVGFSNSSSLNVDSGFGNGGSKLTVGGTLTNNSFINIGNSALSAATTVKAAALVNASNITLTGGPTHANLNITGNASNSGFGFNIDSFSGGGAIFTVGGTLTNTNNLTIGNSSLIRATAVTVAQLANTGSVVLTGGGTAQAKLVVNAAAPSTLTGGFSLAGNALLDYKSGAITAIGSGASLSLNGSKALVDIGATLGNSALKTLASNAGTFNLANGAALTTTVGLSNSSSLNVDSGFGGGGSKFTVGGTLTNNSFINIGNSGLSAATTVKAAALVNNSFSTVQVSGNTSGGKATLNLTGASSNAGNLTIGSGGVLALGGTLTDTGSLSFAGGTISGGTLAGAGSISDSFGTSTLNGVTIAAGATVDVSFGTLIVNATTVKGAIDGGNSSALTFSTAGTHPLTNIFGFPTINLASGGANSLTLNSANFTNVFGGIITVNDGNSGNIITASSLSSANAILVHAGTGTDTLTGGAGGDVFFAASNTTMKGNLGTNQFTFDDIGTNHITDFKASGTNELALSSTGFNLGLAGTSTPQHLDTTLFSTKTDGTFDNTTERFAYNNTSGVLFFGAHGSGGGRSAIVTLTDKGTLSAGAAGNLYFTT